MPEVSVHRLEPVSYQVWLRPQGTVQAVGVRRFRPILLASMTAFVGLLPLMFEQRSGPKFIIPMAISLGWGVVFATVITLILVLVNTLILDDLKRLFRAYWRWLTNTEKPPEPKRLDEEPVASN